MKTFGVTDYTNLVPLKCCGRTGGRTDGRTDGQTDGRSGPTTSTRPAFAKATQLKIVGLFNICSIFWGSLTHSWGLF